MAWESPPTPPPPPGPPRGPSLGPFMPPSPAVPARSGVSGTGLVALLLSLVGAGLIVAGSVLPYARIPGAPPGIEPNLSILDCQFPGCGWYAGEEIGALAVIVVALAILLIVRQRSVSGALLSVAGLWMALVFAGYTGQANADGSGYTPKSGGPIGIAGGVLVLVAGLLLALTARSSARRAP